MSLFNSYSSLPHRTRNDQGSRGPQSRRDPNTLPVRRVFESWPRTAWLIREGKVIDRYFNEHRRAAEKEKRSTAGIKTSPSTPPQQDKPSPSSAGSESRVGTKSAQKRGPATSDGPASNDDLPSKKRRGAILQVKVEPELVIDLTVEKTE